MEDQSLTYEIADGIATITLRCAQGLDAVGAAVLDGFGELVERALTDPGVLAILVAGADAQSFDARVDSETLARLDPHAGVDASTRANATLARLESGGKPALAALSGAVTGVGLEIALACHLRTAAAGARLGLPEAGLGLIPCHGGTQRLARLIGPGRALELILTGEPVDAGRAEALGLVNRVHDGSALMAESRAWLRAIAANGPVALRLSLEAVRHGMDLPLEDGLQLEATLFGIACSTEDAREGVAARVAGRQPSFRNR